MGQGQADVALGTLRECSRNGDWLCLKNLHLVTAWLPHLEKVGNRCAVDYMAVLSLCDCLIYYNLKSFFLFVGVIKYQLLFSLLPIIWL